MNPMINYRSKYEYQKHDRKQITNNIRADLRAKLKEYSTKEISQPETKILDCMLAYFLEDEANKELLSQLVKNYY